MTRPRLLASVLGAVVLAATAWPWLGRDGAVSGVPTLVVARAPFERRVVAEGNLEAAQATPVTAPMEAQGPLRVAWLVPDGTPVAKGDVIVRFDRTEMERSLRDGESDRTSAESRIAAMRADTQGSINNLERDASLARAELAAADRYRIDDPDIFTKQEIIRSEIDRDLAAKRIATSDAVRSIRQDAARLDLALLDIERRKAGLAIDRASKGLEALEITAPHDGILVFKRDWRGEITKVGDTVWPGEPVAEIPELSVMQARVFVLEADAGGLAAGVAARVIVEAHPDISYAAKIKKVDTLAKRRTGWIPVQYFGATLELSASDPSVMKPGQRVRAILSLDARADVVSVPRNAVFEKEGKTFVFKRTRRAFVPVDVVLGPSAVGRVVIDHGLGPGDEIALRDPTASARDDGPATRSEGSAAAVPGAR